MNNPTFCDEEPDTCFGKQPFEYFETAPARRDRSLDLSSGIGSEAMTASAVSFKFYPERLKFHEPMLVDTDCASLQTSLNPSNTTLVLKNSGDVRWSLQKRLVAVSTDTKRNAYVSLGTWKLYGQHCLLQRCGGTENVWGSVRPDFGCECTHNSSRWFSKIHRVLCTCDC